MLISDAPANRKNATHGKRERRLKRTGITSAYDLSKVIESSIAKMTASVKQEGEKMARKTEEAIAEVRLAQARHIEDMEKIRAALNTITGGAIERLVRISKEEELKMFLRERGGWRV